MKTVLLTTIFALLVHSGDATTATAAGNGAAATQSMVQIMDGFSFDDASLIHHPETTEEVLTIRAGMVFYETITHPEFWTFDIFRGNRRVPCKLHCTNEKWPELEAEQNMPMGVLRYLQSTICAGKSR